MIVLSRLIGRDAQPVVEIVVFPWRDGQAQDDHQLRFLVEWLRDVANDLEALPPLTRISSPVGRTNGGIFGRRLQDRIDIMSHDDRRREEALKRVTSPDQERDLKEDLLG